MIDFSRESKRLVQAMAEAGYPVEVLSKSDGYKKWWERAAVAIISAIMALGVTKRDGKLCFVGMRASRKEFDERFTTTFRNRIYWTARAPYNPASEWDFYTLAHECVHVVQAGKTQGRLLERLLGVFKFAWFSITYTILPFPAVVTGRAVWESVAYEEELYLRARCGRQPDAGTVLRFGQNFKDSSYLFMDPLFKGGFRTKGRKESNRRNGYEKMTYLEKKVGFCVNQ